MDPSQTDYPPMKDLSAANITENVNRINSGCKDPRFKFLIERVVQHIHDYARETRLSMAEWEAGIDFLTRVGQMCTKTRQEFILLSDVLGLSTLVDDIDHPKPPGVTESTVLGPFHTDDANEVSNGDDLPSDPDGVPLLVLGTVKDTKGKGIEGVKVDVWETDSHGFYDVQYKDRTGPSGRGILHTDKDGHFWFKGIVPVSYPVPVDGPVGDMLRALRRHPYRPAHVHFMFDKEGYDHYITALTLKGDPYESHDPVFGVKESLVVTLEDVEDPTMSEKYDLPPKTKLLKYDFNMVGMQEATELRAKLAKEVMETNGRKIKFYNDLPVPDVD